MPEISVIVPVYKVEHYLHRCVDSILAQTFTDFELILVDDGSPDGCPAICDEYVQRDARVRVIHQRNSGVSAARNAGMDAAYGKYVMFCDSDDSVDAKWCEIMHRAIERNPEAWVVSNIWRVNENEECVAQVTRTQMEENFDYFQIYKMGLSAYTFNKIYVKEKIERYRFQFDESCGFAEDVAFNVDYAEKCEDIVFINQALYFYQNNPEGIMRRFDSNRFALHLRPFRVRLGLVGKENAAEYCDIWLYQFLNLFDNVFDPRNSMTLPQKLHYNQRMIRSREFWYCLAHASGKNESLLVLKILRTHNYYLFWLFQRLVQLKCKR